MNLSPKTIQIYLPGGDPRGIRMAEITTRIMRLIEVPRSLLPAFLQMPESDQVAVYFLVSVSEDGAECRVYVGQSSDLRTRLTEHNKNKSFWQRALVMVSRTHNLTQTHALFLEWHSLQTIRQTGRFSDENGNRGSRPHTPAPMEADCLEMFDTSRTLLATLGFPLFDPVAHDPNANQPPEIFVCEASGTQGRGQYTEEGFVVLQGSVGRLQSVPSLQGTSDDSFRQRLLAQGVMRAEGHTVVFQRDHLFRSPSMAALALLGRTANGWLEWKSPAGRTLDDLKRQAN
ncbi:GIY-YIG nuclease family protein [Curvibacter sp. RS43]|uniref:GIY-YIG nuclease family protein n=1 Tax=Curvibacter microcysteis TaxID=3026419 RepID=UPI002360F3A5|nr:GIY-YIG nuclease family protein [Curvibacter sp. RS43]MDD0811187.1 GIY-YIG nuclease family protein [Curvibacter sp. RS43]